jgi:putative ubiquitin-RnfH superfamily antitoxin RatB of RatAB toxin-antitoxin module
MAVPEALSITVVFANDSRSTQVIALSMQTGSTVAMAVRQSKLLSALSESEIDQLVLGIRGRKVPPKQVLRDGDRIDICRPLKVDPKVARRQRFARQGAKTAGLFAKRRAGAKAGY